MKEAAEKTAFITDKGKWIFHSLLFGINIGPSAFSYVLGKVLVQCTKFALSFLDSIMIFSAMWQEHLQHLEEVFKWLEAAGLKIKGSKCKFFKTKVHYIGFLVGIDGVKLLPKKVTAIEVLQPLKDIDECRQFLASVGFYRKFTPFFADFTACLNTMSRKGATFHLTTQCKNSFKFLKDASFAVS